MGDVKNNELTEEKITNKLDVDELNNVSGGKAPGGSSKQAIVWCPKCDTYEWLRTTGNERTWFWFIKEYEWKCYNCQEVFWEKLSHQ